MRAVGLWFLFVLGLLAGLIPAIVLFFVALARKARAFHPEGSQCRAEITALDGVVGPRLAGPAKVRLSPVSGPESSTDRNVCGLAIKFGDNQDTPLATFEAFTKLKEAPAHIDPLDYMNNEYASVTPWRVKGLGVVWLRAMPVAEAKVGKTGTRVERLEADIAAGRARLVLEARERWGRDAPVVAKLAEIKLTDRTAVDLSFKMSMWRHHRGVVPTGFRNGIRAIVYPLDQAGRSLRGG